jgi:hypothetical protein
VPLLAGLTAGVVVQPRHAQEQRRVRELQSPRLTSKLRILLRAEREMLKKWVSSYREILRRDPAISERDTCP